MPGEHWLPLGARCRWVPLVASDWPKKELRTHKTCTDTIIPIMTLPFLGFGLALLSSGGGLALPPFRPFLLGVGVWTIQPRDGRPTPHSWKEEPTSTPKEEGQPQPREGRTNPYREKQGPTPTPRKGRANPRLLSSSLGYKNYYDIFLFLRTITITVVIVIVKLIIMMITTLLFLGFGLALLSSGRKFANLQGHSPV